MKNLHLFSILFSLLTLSSCNLTPIKLDSPPPSIPNGTDSAEIVVLRDGSWVGAAVSPGVYINDLHVGQLGVSDYVSHKVPAGQVKMFVGTEARSEASFPVEAGQSYYLKIYMKAGWWIARAQLEIVQDPSAGKEMSKSYDDATFDTPKPFPFTVN